MIFEFSRLKYTLEVEVRFSQFSAKKFKNQEVRTKNETFLVIFEHF